MTKLQWHAPGQKRYNTGLSNGVLYLPDPNTGAYDEAHAWNGLTTVTESPTGAESNKQYADNVVYANIKSAEEFGATIEAFSSPAAFDECDGARTPAPGVSIGQQGRRTFGFAWRTRVGNDLLGDRAGFKIHLAWGCDAAPSEKSHVTVNDSPELSALSWEVTSTPVAVGEIEGVEYDPTAKMTIDSTLVTEASMNELLDVLYGTVGQDGRLPMPAEVVAIVADVQAEVETTAPTYDAGTDIITIPSTTGVEYLVDGEVVPSGAYGPITEDTMVTARPAAGYKFSQTSDEDWAFNFA